MRKKYISIIAVLFVAIFAVFLVFFGLNNEANQVYSMKVHHFQKQITELEDKQKSLDKKINRLYVDNNQTYVIRELSEEKITEVEENIIFFDEDIVNIKKEIDDLTVRNQKKYTDEIKMNELDESLKNYYINIKDLRIKRELTDLINSLFLSEFLNNAKINDNVYIANDLNTEIFEKINTRLTQAIIETPLINGEEYSKSMNRGLEVAEMQLEDLNLAVELRDELFNINDFLVKTDSEKIKEFWSVVEKIKNPEIQSSFDKYIRATKAYINEEEKEVNSNNSEEQESVEGEGLTNDGQKNNKRPVSNGRGTEPILRPQPDPKPKPELEQKPEQKPELEQKPEPEPEPKPEPNPEPKPEPNDPEESEDQDESV